MLRTKSSNDGSVDQPPPCRKTSNRIVPYIPTENKENSDPFICDTVMEEDDLHHNNSSMNCDGFEICDDLKLDSPNKVSESDDESSPFISSLIRNKMVSLDKATTLKLLSGEDGCSPALGDISSKENSRIGTPVAPPASKFRRCISMVERPMLTPDMLLKPVTSFPDFTSPVSRASFKRPVPPHQENEQGNSKKAKCSSEQIFMLPTLKPSKSMSVLNSPSIASIMHACSLSDKPNLTADRSSQLSLPTILGSNKNLDLNSIDCRVMADLINGYYADKIASYRIIDARYDYEYKGGHIKGAENFGMWDEQSFIDEFFPKSLPPKKLTFNNDEKSEAKVYEKRHIIIFHCEFSSARGPALLRLLRKKDREVNNASYPALHYPECYLLHEGYKAFFARYAELCDPQSYVPMNDPNYISEERKFHKKSRSWAAGGGGGNTVARTGASSRLLKL